MGILISRRGVLKVTEFSDLRAAYGKFRAARDSYWDDLGTKVKIISSGFSQYLTPDQPYYIDRDGSKKPYVQIGKTELGSFEAVRNADQLEDQDYGLEFALAVVVDEDPDSLPKERFAVEINVRKTEGRYEFKLRTSVGKRIVKIPESFGEAEQADLYEAILGELIKVLNPARFA